MPRDYVNGDPDIKEALRGHRTYPLFSMAATRQGRGSEAAGGAGDSGAIRQTFWESRVESAKETNSSSSSADGKGRNSTCCGSTAQASQNFGPCKRKRLPSLELKRESQRVICEGGSVDQFNSDLLVAKGTGTWGERKGKKRRQAGDLVGGCNPLSQSKN